MSGLFGSSKPAPITPAPPPPNKSSQEVADAAAAQRAFFYRSSNSRANTQLTSGFGAQTQPYSAVAQLFGQSGKS